MIGWCSNFVEMHHLLCDVLCILKKMLKYFVSLLFFLTIFFSFWFSLTYPIPLLSLPRMVVASNLRLTFAGICGFGECFTLC